MDKLSRTIKAAAAHSGGGQTPSALYALATTRQGDIHQPGLSESESLTIEVDGQPLPCYTFPADSDESETAPDGRTRSTRLAAKALAALWHRHGPIPATTALVFSINPDDWPDDPAEAIQEPLVNECIVQGEVDLADWCRLTAVYRMDAPEDQTQIANEASLVWLSADSMINHATLDRHGDRIAIKQFEDGLILGEAATAIWLTTEDQPAAARLTIHPEPIARLSGEAPAEIHPDRHGLVTHLDQDLDQQAQWQQWLGDFEPTTEYDTRQHTSVTLGFGYVGVAGPGLAVLCALGRAQMPCPPVNIQWLFHQNLDNSYSLLKLDSYTDTVQTTPQPKQGGLSG